MSDEIRVQYEELERVATGFANQADQVATTNQFVRRAMEALEGGGWIGRGAESFYQEMNSEVLPSVERLRRALEQADELTRRIANQFREAETEASGYFRR